MAEATKAHELGDFAAARALCQQVLDQQPDHAEGLNLLGVITCQLGDPGRGIVWIAKACAAQPDNASFLNNLATGFSSLDRDQEALLTYRRAIELEPGHATTHNNIATVYRSLGQLAEAAEHYERAIQLRPDYAEALSNYGNILVDLGALDKAVETLQAAIGYKETYAPAYNNLAIARQRQGKYGEAQDVLRRAIHLDPEFADPYTNLAEVLKETGQADAAIVYYEKSMALAPNRASSHSNYLYALNNLDGVAAEFVAGAHRQWNDRHVPMPVPACRQPVVSHAKLRIGYVSPDFRRHSVSYFMRPLIANHDRQAFEIYCYSNGHIEDEVTTVLKNSADHWRSIFGVSDGDATALIGTDEIDILVDLSGHTMGNRLSLFGQKPAPVQVSYLGYPATTGLAAMDYRLTDAWADPVGKTERFHSEKLMRIAGGFLCFQPPDDAPPVGELPSLKNRYVTFGSANNLAKLTVPVIAAWAAILRRVPDAKLLLKGKAFADDRTRDSFMDAFAAYGVAADRLVLRPWITETSALSIYNEMDIALDPFPYNGTTTLCETHWMGVPTVVLEGQWHAARVGLSLNAIIGHPELTAPDMESYIQLAEDLSDDADRLQWYRRNLRADMKTSRLCNGSDFARAIEDVYVKMTHSRD